MCKVTSFGAQRPNFSTFFATAYYVKIAKKLLQIQQFHPQDKVGVPAALAQRLHALRLHPHGSLDEGNRPDAQHERPWRRKPKIPPEKENRPRRGFERILEGDRERGWMIFFLRFNTQYQVSTSRFKYGFRTFRTRKPQLKRVNVNIDVIEDGGSHFLRERVVYSVRRNIGIFDIAAHACRFQIRYFAAYCAPVVMETVLFCILGFVAIVDVFWEKRISRAEILQLPHGTYLIFLTQQSTIP